ncbi:hypothetical protein ACLPHM_01210 [Paenalcaligenes sp. Me131]|uniref:hypothetical protein n=1 Tax=Paenalcaligenes sp. Me131 TaxID=3392636 RepID=UPI003D29FCB0
MTTATSSTSHKLLRQALSAIYFFGGIVGLYVLLSQAQIFMVSALAIILFSLMLIQNVVAIYGGVRFWRGNPEGGQLLYWLSWTSVPVFSSTMLSYHSIIGLGLTPTITLTPGMYDFHIQFTLGYEGALKWFPTFDIFQLGLNLAPLLFIAVIRALLQANSDTPVKI